MKKPTPLSKPLTLLLLQLALLAGACAPLPPLPKRPPFATHRGIKDPPDALQTYYNFRLTPAESAGYLYGKLVIPKRHLDAFMDAQGDTVAAKWARHGNWFIDSGWLLALGIEAAAIAVSVNATDNDLAKNAWAVGLIPAGLVSWTFYWIGDNWFRKPAVAHYDLQLKRELKLTKD